jgi:hypothetical protein
MNEHDPLEETVAHFREMAPPADVRRANRMAVQAALERPVVTHWWQRTVSMPLPAVLATAAALVLSLSIHLLHPRGSEEFSKPSVAVPSAVDSDNSATTLVGTGSNFQYSETQSYLSGVGVIGRNIVYQFKE